MTEIILTRPEITTDQVLGFTIPAQHARGRVVRLEGVLDQILSAHDYPEPSRGCSARRWC